MIFKTAPHNPPHLFVAGALYMLTASIYGAWVVLHNHYHAIVRSPQHACNLFKFINSYHKYTVRKWNNEDGLKSRKIWWNYWDTCIRSEHDYYNRLRYVFWNPVKHGLADKPEDYNFSNYGEYLNAGFDFTGVDEVDDVPEF